MKCRCTVRWGGRVVERQLLYSFFFRTGPFRMGRSVFAIARAGHVAVEDIVDEEEQAAPVFIRVIEWMVK